jgi:glycosyltransferase involved in cell wall biosynthesis
MLKAAIKSSLFSLCMFLAFFKRRSNKPSSHIYIVGDLYSESGLGEITRAIIASLGEIKNYSLINLPMSIQSKQSDYRFSAPIVNGLGKGVTIIVGNPSILLTAIRKLNIFNVINNYTIGVWFWELEKIPKDWIKAGKLVDEVWAQSSFVAKAFLDSNEKVFVMPLSLDYKDNDVKNFEKIEIPPNKYIFLMSFDYLSHVARKNPMAVIKAFFEEFQEEDGVILIVKSVNRDKISQANLSNQLSLKDHPNIIYSDQYLSKDEMMLLMKSANCYISLHRSEGLGLGLAEAMRLGTLTVATAYSGNMEFMSISNSLLVDFEMTPVISSDYPYSGDNFWADPINLDARKKMRIAYVDSTGNEALISRAKSDLSAFNLERQRAWINARLAEIL